MIGHPIQSLLGVLLNMLCVPYYLLKIWQVLDSETQLFPRVLNEGLWTVSGTRHKKSATDSGRKMGGWTVGIGEFLLHIILHLLTVNNVNVLLPQKINTGNHVKNKTLHFWLNYKENFKDFWKTEITALLLLMLSKQCLSFWFCWFQCILFLEPFIYWALTWEWEDLLFVF